MNLDIAINAVFLIAFVILFFVEINNKTERSMYAKVAWVVIIILVIIGYALGLAQALTA